MQAYFGLASLAAILDLVTVEDWGEKIFAERVRVKWKNGQGEKGRGRKNTPTPTLPLHQPSTGQASSYNPRWWHRTDLSSVLLRNNACIAGYKLLVFTLQVLLFVLPYVYKGVLRN